MARTLKPDKILFLATLLLISVSLIMVYSASAVMAQERFRQADHFLIRQTLWAALGLAVMAIVMRIDYRLYRHPAVTRAMVGVTVLTLAAVLFGPSINGTRRWFGVGGIGIQPSEFAKLAVIVFVAASLEKRMARISEVVYALSPIAITVSVVLGLILLEPDFGSAMTMLVVVAVMVFAAGLPYRRLLEIALVGLPVIAGVLLGASYRRKRLLAFWHPWDDPRGDGFQIIQSLIAVGTGGFTGKGLMAGVQKLFYLPEPHTDFIFAVIAEELGLIGATVILACFCVIAWRGLRVALKAPDAFGSLLAIGLTTMVSAQAFINISVVLGLMPTKGIPLPFVSSGGSSLVIGLLGLGVLINISQRASATV
jgi:cell division protein FtsW